MRQSPLGLDRANPRLSPSLGERAAEERRPCGVPDRPGRDWGLVAMCGLACAIGVERTNHAMGYQQDGEQVLPGRVDTGSRTEWERFDGRISATCVICRSVLQGG